MPLREIPKWRAPQPAAVTQSLFETDSSASLLEIAGFEAKVRTHPGLAKKLREEGAIRLLSRTLPNGDKGVLYAKRVRGKARLVWEVEAWRFKTTIGPGWFTTSVKDFAELADPTQKELTAAALKLGIKPSRHRSGFQWA